MRKSLRWIRSIVDQLLTAPGGHRLSVVA